MKIVVTGASGFVGTSLVPFLEQRGHDVVPLSPVQVAGDICVISPANVEGADVVVHLAALAHANDVDPAEVHRVNVEGTRAVQQACEKAEVPRIVFLSSIKALAESSVQPLKENDTAAPEDAYGRAKLAAEEMLLARDKTRAVIVRPPLVYGQGIKGNLARLLRLADSGIPLPFGAVANRRSMIGLANLCSFIAVLCEQDAPARLYHVADADSVSLRDLVGAMRSALGRPARMVPLPAGLLRLVMTLVSSGDAGKLLDDLELDTSLARQDLDWLPPVAFADGIAEMCRETRI